MNNSDLRGLSIEQLQSHLIFQSEHYRKLKFAHSITPIENPMKIRETRRILARINTVIREKEIKNEPLSTGHDRLSLYTRKKEKTQRKSRRIEFRKQEQKNTSVENDKSSQDDSLLNLSPLQTEQDMHNRYYIDPSTINLSGPEVNKAIDSFYQHNNSVFEHEISFSPQPEDVVLEVGKPQKFQIEMMVRPHQNFDKELLKQFIVSFGSFELEFEGKTIDKVSFFDNERDILEFVGTPTKSGICEVFLDCWQNSNHFYESSQLFTVRPS